MLKIHSSVMVFLILFCSLTDISAKVCTKDLIHSYVIYKMDSFTQKLNSMYKVRKSVIFVCCEGYREVSRRYATPKCEAICTLPCINGVCISPGFCQCNFGYEKTVMGSCELITTTQLPIPMSTALDEKTTERPLSTAIPSPLHLDASTSIESRLATTSISPSPTKVSCSEGYSLSQDGGCIQGSTTRLPISTGFDQLHITKTQLNVTTELIATINCPMGYNLDLYGKCKAICHHTCLQNRCLAPNKCECPPGYIHDPELQQCKPLCNGKIYGCVHGTCVGYNQCRCDNGTVLHENELFRCEVAARLDDSAFNRKWLFLLLIIPAGIAFITAFIIVERWRKAKWNRINAQCETFPEVRFQDGDSSLGYVNQHEVVNEMYGTAGLIPGENKTTGIRD